MQHNKIITIEAALAEAKSSFNDSPTPALDAELLLSHVLQVPLAYLYTWPAQKLTVTQIRQFSELVARRNQGEPIAYLIGHQGFWTLDLLVQEGVLIPRPETELLVEIGLKLFADKQPRVIADLGTGSGAIALALASERPNWQIIAVDNADKAIQLATKNSKCLHIHEFRTKCETRSLLLSPARSEFAHGDSRGRIPILPLENPPSGKEFRTKCETRNIINVQFILADFYQALPNYQFDAIISNPPYIAENDPHLSQGDVRFEPRAALVAGEDGLAAIRQIAKLAKYQLKSDGYLLFEHGNEQGQRVRDILSVNGYQEIITKQDLAGYDRVTYGKYLNA
jgi:release factor glutamine methyltransferase